MHGSVCVFVAKPVAVELGCHATALILFSNNLRVLELSIQLTKIAILKQVFSISARTC